MALVLFAATGAHAAERVWTGGGVDGNWATTNNWTNGLAPDSNDNLIFSGTSGLNTTNNLSAANSANNGIWFTNNAGAFTLSGSNVTLDVGSGYTIRNTSLNIQTINLNIVMAANGVYDIASNNVVINGAVSGAFTFTKQGAATLILNGSNSYTGATTVSVGALRAGNSNSLGTTAGGVTVANGAALELSTGTNGSSISIGAEALTINGAGIGSAGALRNVSGTNTYGGTIAFASDATVGADASTQLNLTNTLSGNFIKTFTGAGNINVSGVISGTTGVTKTGAGTLTLSAANTYTGDTIIGVGVARLSGSGSIDAASGLVVSNGATFDLNSISETVDGISDAGVIALGSATLTLSNSATNNFSGSLSGTGGLVKVGAGTQILSGATNSYGGTTTVGGGVLRVTSVADAGANSSIGTNGTIIVTNSGVFDYAGTTNASMNRGINLAAGSGLIGVSNSAASLTISGVISNTGSLVKTNAGELILTASNSYSGTTLVTNGVLNIQNSSALGGTGSGTTVGSGAALELQGGITVGAETLNLSGTGLSSGGALRNVSGDNTYQGTITNTAAARINSDAGTLTISGAVNATNQLLTLGGAGNILVSGAITNSSAGLTKDGAGTATLSGANTYQGLTTISVGALRAANAAAFGSTAGGVSVTSGAALELSNNVTIGAEALSLSGTGLSSGGALRSVSGDNTYQGTITNTAAARINSDAGTLTLSGAINATNQLLTLGGAGNILVSGAITNSSAGLTKDGAGTLTLGAANTYTGLTTISGGTLAYGITNALSTGGVTVNGANAVFDIASFSDSVGAVTLVDGTITGTTGVLTNTVGYTVTNGLISANLAGTVAMAKGGSGTVTLSGSNSYTGATTIGGGALRAANSNALGTVAGSTIISNAAALELTTNSAGQGIVLGDAISVAGTGISQGGAIRNIAGNNSITNLITLTNATRINSDGGTLTLDVASGAAITNAAAQNLTFGGEGNITVNDSIGTLTGTLSKDGTGTLTLAAANTYGGVTTIGGGVLNAGTLTNAGIASSIGTNATIIITNDGKLHYTGGTASMNRGVNLSGGVGDTGEISVSNVNTALTISGVISNSGTLVKSGAGTLILAASNNYSGGTLLNAGTLSAGNAFAFGSGSVTITNGTTLNLSNFSIANTLINAGGTLTNVGTVSGAQFSGGTTTLGASSNTVASVSGTATVDVSGANTTITNMTGGTVNVASTSTNSTLQTISGGTVNAATNIVVQTYNGGNISNSTAVTISSGSSAGSISGAGNLIKVGGGTLQLSGNNSYTGTTFISNGVVAISTNAALSGTALINMNNNTALVYEGGSASISRNISVTNGTATIANTGGGTLTLAGALSKNGTVLVFSNGTFNVTGVISGASANSDLIVDNATVTLSNANTYNGPTYIRNAGNLTAAVIGAMPTNTRSAVIMDDTVGSSNSVFNVTASQLIASLAGTNTSSASIATNTSLTIGTTSGNTTFAGVISGGGVLIKDGASTQTLTGNNAFTGGTLVSAGVLQVGNGAATGSLAGPITNNASLIFNRSDDALVQSGSISGSGSLVKQGGGTVTLSGANTYSGGTLISAGTLAGSTTSLQGNITNNATVDFTQTNNGTYAGTLSGTGALTKGGTAILTLGSSNSFSGGTTVREGELHVNSNGGLGTGAVTLAGTNPASLAALHYSNTASPLSIGALTLNGNAEVALQALASISSTSALTINSTNNFISIGGANWSLGTNTLVSGASLAINGGESILLTGTTLNNGTLGLGSTTNIGRSSFTFGSNATSFFLTTGGVSFDVVWTGAQNNLWNTNAANWQQTTNGLNPSGTNIAFLTDDDAYFGNTATNAPITVDTGGVQAAEMYVTNSGGTVVFNGASLSAHDLYKSGSGNLTISNSLQLIGNDAAGPNTGVLNNTGSGNVTLEGVFSEGSLVQSGSGTLTLAAANTYAGTTTIAGGVVAANTLANGGSASSIGSGSSTAILSNNGVLRYTGATVSTDRGLNLAGNGVVGVSNSTTALTINGVISNTGALGKFGAGTLILTGANTYAGGTTLGAGTLRLGNATAAGSGTITQSNGTTLIIDTTGTVANAMSIYNITTLQSVTLSGNKTLNNATYNVTNNTTTTETGLLSGAGGVTKEGAGTLVLAGSANNTYTDATVINSGALVLSNSAGNAINNSSGITVNSGSSLILGASNQIGDGIGLTLNGGTFIVGNATAGYSETLGTLTLTADSTIDLGSFSTGLRTLSFANSSAITWTGTLTITNWQGFTRAPSDVAQILFGTGGLTTTQLGQIYFANQDINGGVLVGGNGELVPIPEAEVYWGALAVVLAVGYRERRRLVSILRQVRR